LSRSAAPDISFHCG